MKLAFALLKKENLLLGSLGGLFLSFLFFPLSVGNVFFQTLWMPLIWAFLVGIAAAERNHSGFVATFLGVALLPCFALAYYQWGHASEESFSLGGIIPWSDASCYSRQAVELALHGVTQTGMNGRFLYAAFFSSLLKLSGCHLQLALFLVSSFFAAAFFLVLRQVGSLVGGVATAFFAIVPLLFYRTHVAGVVMTEGLGMIAGMLAFSAFLWMLERRQFRFFFLFLFLLSLGLWARPGAFFILPGVMLVAAFFLWKEVAQQPWGKRFFLLVGFLVLGGAMAWLPLGLNQLMGKQLYHGAVTTNGNFSYTLYGLLSGGTWSDALPWSHWDPKIVMAKNKELIQAEPQRLFLGVLRAYKEALYRRVLFLFGHEDRPATLLLLLFLVGIGFLYPIEARLKKASFAAHKKLGWQQGVVLAPFLWAIAVGIFCSIPFIPPWDAAERPFAATIPLQAFVVAIGVVVILEKFFKQKYVASFFAKLPELFRKNSFSFSCREFLARKRTFFTKGEKWLFGLLSSLLIIMVVLPFFFSKNHAVERSAAKVLDLTFKDFQEVPTPLLRQGSYVVLDGPGMELFQQGVVPFLEHNKEFASSPAVVLALLPQRLPQGEKCIIGLDWRDTLGHPVLYLKSAVDPKISPQGLKNIFPNHHLIFYHGWEVDAQLVPFHFN